MNDSNHPGNAGAAYTKDLFDRQINLLDQRRAGILLHITSLPGKYEQGDMGKEAYHFIDFLKNTGVSVWQTLPLGIPHGDRSPYQCLSAHAGNPDLISLDWLIDKGWLTESDIPSKKDIPYDFAYRHACIRACFLHFQKCADRRDIDEFSQFCTDKAWWLDDFALFMALKKEFDQIAWSAWPAHFKNREQAALEEVRSLLQHDIEETKFEQFIFFKQWQKLKQYAHMQGVALFGDIPIFVSYDSADVWAQRQNFKLDASGAMPVVAGVPPDYFSETGQRWGNPHFNWDYLQQTGFRWWIDRIRTQLEMFDIIRIDHFRGLEAAWEIPASEDTAINGQWVKAPGGALLAQIKREFGSIPLVAEDLGIITPEVEVLRDKFNLPGMKILQFAFGGGTDNPYLPFNYPVNCVVYTGTHDNDTTLGWYNSLSEEQKYYVQEYLCSPQISMPHTLIHAALSSVANLAVIPMQDILKLDSEHRMNIPGTIEGNWKWRFQWNQLTEDMVQELAHMVGIFGRARTA